MKAKKVTAPLVLIHGFCGAPEFSVAGMPIARYFPGIKEWLEDAGNTIYTPRLSPTRGVADRAEELRAFLDRELPRTRVHLIAHSMGGLDARWMISKLDMADRVLSLTTLGTPHWGTPFADWGIQRFERLLRPVLELLQVPVEGFYDLTTENCRRFNETVEDSPGVHYFSIAGHYSGYPLKPEWFLSYSILYRAEGPNDGIVSVRSASWGKLLAVVPCDHLQLVGWTHGVFLPAENASQSDARNVFATVTRKLVEVERIALAG